MLSIWARFWTFSSCLAILQVTANIFSLKYCVAQDSFLDHFSYFFYTSYILCLNQSLWEM